ncbi:MAG: nucleoside-diphosphate kinase [Spirochaetaceae bacterium]|nr:MAG: nucleoside-diphosphate kinase [Spirochaetaceae bacterium]
METTYVMLKPGVLQRRLAGEIIRRIEQKGLTIVGMKLMQIPKERAETHYSEHQGKGFFADLIGYITSGPVLAMAIRGEGSIAAVRRLCGATKIEDALPGTIRGDFAGVTTKNIIHASDSPESAEREMKLFFNDGEIVEYEAGNEEWVY